MRFVLLIWQLAIKEERQMAKFARCSFAETTANCSNSFCHFHLIDLIREPAPTASDSVYFWFVSGFLSIELNKNEWDEICMSFYSSKDGCFITYSIL